MIRSLEDKQTEAVFTGKLPKAVPVEIFKQARNKLLLVDAAERLDDLEPPP